MSEATLTFPAEVAAAIRRVAAVPEGVPDAGLLDFLAIAIDEASARENAAFSRGFLQGSEGIWFEVSIAWDGQWRARAACNGFETGEVPTDDVIAFLERQLVGLCVGGLGVFQRCVAATRAILEAEVAADVSHCMAAQDGHPEPGVIRRAFLAAVSDAEVKVYELVAQVDDNQVRPGDEIVRRDDGQRTKFAAVLNPRRILTAGDDQKTSEADPHEYGLIVAVRREEAEHVG